LSIVLTAGNAVVIAVLIVFPMAVPAAVPGAAGAAGAGCSWALESEIGKKNVIATKADNKMRAGFTVHLNL
jgi:hypothetical protein